MDAMAWDRNVDLAELHPSFPLGSLEVAVPPSRPQPAVPRCGPLECGTSVRIVGGRLLGPEAHSRYLVGEHRSDVSFPVTDARPWYSCRPDRGVRHRARGCAGTLEVGGFLGCAERSERLVGRFRQPTERGPNGAGTRGRPMTTDSWTCWLGASRRATPKEFSKPIG